MSILPAHLKGKVAIRVLHLSCPGIWSEDHLPARQRLRAWQLRSMGVGCRVQGLVQCKRAWQLRVMGVGCRVWISASVPANCVSCESTRSFLRRSVVLTHSRALSPRNYLEGLGFRVQGYLEAGQMPD